jgi:hypothetical protein
MWEYAIALAAAAAGVETLIVAAYLADPDPCLLTPVGWMLVPILIGAVLILFPLAFCKRRIDTYRGKATDDVLDEYVSSGTVSSLLAFVLGVLLIIATALLSDAIAQTCASILPASKYVGAFWLFAIVIIVATFAFGISSLLDDISVCRACFDDMSGPACFAKHEASAPFYLLVVGVVLAGVGIGITLLLSIPPARDHVAYSVTYAIPAFIGVGLYIIAAAIYMFSACSTENRGTNVRSIIVVALSLLVAIGVIVTFALLSMIGSPSTSAWAVFAPVYGTLLLVAFVSCCLSTDTKYIQAAVAKNNAAMRTHANVQVKYT